MKQSKWDDKHNKNIARYLRRIQKLYDAMINEAVVIGASVKVLRNRPFSFDDYPRTKKRADRLIRDMQREMEAIIVNGVESEWTLSNNKNNELSRRLFGDNIGKLTPYQYRKYFSNNDNARKAFLARKTAGMTISDRVWKYTEQFKNEIEMALDIGIRSGLPAGEMARELRHYLQHPDKIFRRVRDEHGRLHPSKNSFLFRPGAGVYRSSQKNAERLARTETNMAYRTSDWLRWQQFDFVVGYEIKRSNNPYPCPICETLKGKYPKDFKFTGWHPQCRCFAVSILKTPEELFDKNNTNSVNEITDVPLQFKSWIKENKNRIAVSAYNGTTPSFLLENDKYVNIAGFKATKQQKIIADSRRAYLRYNPTFWERDYFNKENGGYLVIDNARVRQSQISKAEKTKFEKERAMSRVFAQNGYNIEMLKEESGKSSADVLINGLRADLKRTSSHNNIIKYAKKAVRKQGSDIVLFQFDIETKEVHRSILNLRKIGIKGYYFFTDRKGCVFEI